MDRSHIHKYMSICPSMSKASACACELASARALLASHCQPDESVGDLSSVFEVNLYVRLEFDHQYIQCLLNTHNLC